MKKKIASSVDVLSHILVPEMKVLSDAEKGKVFSKFGINNTQLPRIYITDPTVTALKANVGDVIRIDRDDGTGKYTTYRVVIE